jgi:hypothetical protein
MCDTCWTSCRWLECIFVEKEELVQCVYQFTSQHRQIKADYSGTGLQ